MEPARPVVAVRLVAVLVEPVLVRAELVELARAVPVELVVPARPVAVPVVRAVPAARVPELAVERVPVGPVLPSQQALR
ncbi:hypothetical protein O6072_18745 [Mycolicibacterium neoaurum]|uniref:hypothetical protein n=1 Tax=Mycolicibacterium neoaurum TaxID=1795 RepID=UPI00248C223A|nr:hypothetical protein [Mycolicibacterium neoaurum]WBP93144.1 hypothetical protein O7W24_18500 [Mycolicibacterium neoaurum]WBS06889.1 hypothetical protein O6072_18745 [Mycolicibacterium neoaurum]